MMDYLEKLAKIMTAPQDAGLSKSAPVIAMFLMDWRPSDTLDDNEWNMTSHDISCQLEDICPVTYEEITAVMLYLGYRVNCKSIYGPRWSMVPANQPNG